MPLCPLCTGVSQMNSPMAQTQSHNHTLDGCVTYNWSYGHFCDFFGLFWPKFGCHQGRSHRGGHGGRVPRAPYHVPYIKMTTDSLSSELSFDEWHGVILQRIIRPTLLLHVINHYTTCCFWQLCDPAPLFAIIGAPYHCSSPQRRKRGYAPGCHGNVLRSLQWKCLLWIGWPPKPPVISNRIVVCDS